jgi:hypothetical protein
MPGANMLQHSIESDLDHYTETTLPPLQHQWPLLGKELFALEHTLTDAPGMNRQPLTEEEKGEKRAAIRNAVVAQLYHEEGTYTSDTRYLAFLLIKAGRGGAIVGNPYTTGKGDVRQELPYTGLEGYYAGSERTPERGGMTPEEIIQEEANIGAQTLKGIKKHAIAQNSWVTYSRLKHSLEEEKPGLEELRVFRVLWSAIVRQLHVRIFRNLEFDLTLTERIEQLERLLNGLPGRTAEDMQSGKDIHSECDRLKRELGNLSGAEREHERQERRTRESIRSDRLAEFQCFREETYQMLTEPEQERYLIGSRMLHWRRQPSWKSSNCRTYLKEMCILRHLSISRGNNLRDIFFLPGWEKSGAIRWREACWSHNTHAMRNELLTSSEHG